MILVDIARFEEIVRTQSRGDRMPRKVSDRTLLRRVLREVLELRSPDGARRAIGLRPRGQDAVVAVPIHLTTRRHSAELETMLLQQGLDDLLDLLPIGALGKALRVAARKRVVMCVDRQGLSRVRHGRHWVWVYAFQGGSYVYGGPKLRLTLTDNAGASAAYATSGSLDQWRARVIPILEENPRQLVVVSHALSAALRRPLGHPSMTLALVAPTSTGKTTTQRLVASMLGEPIVTPWNATSLGLQKWLVERPDQPVTLEDFHRADTAEDLAAVIMAVGNNASRITARAAGTEGEIPGIESTPIVSAERSLVSQLRGGTSGLLARYFEIGVGREGMFDGTSAFGDARAMVYAIDETIRLNHGTAWPAWLSAVSQRWADVARWHNQRLATVRMRVVEAAGKPELGELTGRLADRLAFSAFVGVVATKVGFWSIPAATIYAAFGLVLREYFGRLTSGEGAFSSKALEAIAAFIERHRSRFYPLREVNNATPPPGLIGYTTTIRGRGPVYLFPPGLFAEEFGEHGDEAYAALRQADLIVTQAQRGHRLSVRIPRARDKRRSRMDFIAVKEAIRFSRHS
jgi:hypothetical protein